MLGDKQIGHLRDADAHADAELRIDPDNLTNPWQAAFASFVSFAVGAVVPLLAVLIVGKSLRVPVTVAAVVVALLVTGSVSAGIGGGPRSRAIVRNVVGGLLAMAITYGIGSLVGRAV